MNNYIHAREQVKTGKTARRTFWQNDIFIRLASEGDNDYLNMDGTIDGLIVSECPTRKCDCIICVYSPTSEDQLANDWLIL